MKKSNLKLFGALAGAAAVAALLPYSVKDDPQQGTTTISALLWKYTSRPDPEDPSRKQIDIDLGLRNSFKNQKGAALDELENSPLVDVTDNTPACDIELTLEPKLDNEESAEAPQDPQTEA